MAKHREVPCKHYIALEQCKKGRDARRKIYCQHCDKYSSSARVRSLNKKKQYNEKQKSQECINASNTERLMEILLNV